MTRILNRTYLPHSKTAYEFEGHLHGAGALFIVIRFRSTKSSDLKFRALLTEGDAQMLFHREA